jgi:signal transduction histidine kinase
LRDLSQSVNDMAERLALLQETVQKTEQLRLIGQLSSGLAHQLRNAVTGAKLAVQLHQSECPQSDGEALQVTLRQLTLMEANLRRFMDLGKMGSSPLGQCSIPAIIDEVLSLLRPQCKHTSVELRWTVPTEPLEIDGDAARLRDLLLNVIGNAVEAAGQDGVVEVRAMGNMPHSSVMVEVVDTGPGPPAAIAERLFEPFVTGKPEGVGLGLAVAQQAAEAHHGSIAWSRKEGKTVFRIELGIGK